MSRNPRSTALLLAAALAAAAPAPPAARADDPVPPAAGKEGPAENVSEEKAKEAIDRFQREFQGEDLDLRLEAMGRVRRVMHPAVANLLLDLALKSPEVLVRAAAFKGLAFQRTSAKTVGPRVAKYLGEAAEENRKAKARGDYGVLIDRKTGEVDTESAEGKAALRNKRDRGQMLAEAVKLLDGIGYRERESVDVLREFLLDGNDDLVALVLGMFGKWKEWTVLDPDFKELFDIYPEEDKFETGSVSVDTGAAGSTDQQAAKRKWMSKFGDPDRRRARPKVVRALKQALLDITGEKIETPKALREFLKRPDVKRKVRAK